MANRSCRCTHLDVELKSHRVAARIAAGWLSTRGQEECLDIARSPGTLRYMHGTDGAGFTAVRFGCPVGRQIPGDKPAQLSSFSVRMHVNPANPALGLVALLMLGMYPRIRTAQSNNRCRPA